MNKLEKLLQVQLDEWKYEVKCHMDEVVARDKEIGKLRDELKRYKQAEQEGRLVVLPCKVGDTVYAVYGCFNKSIGIAIVKQICVRDNEIRVVLNNSIEKIWGRSVFATQEEAEKALEVRE